MVSDKVEQEEPVSAIKVPMGAESLDLSYCPLGVTGEPWIGQLLDQPGLVGVGAAFVGSKST